ncbi:MAG: ABC transporter permease [Deltaproteobacteria bacterium]|nr:ABC transporter permease [Deltaproteobacteria bacterium]
MNFLRAKAIAEKEMIHILRDPRSLLMAIAIPLLLLFLFGYALTLDVDNVPLAVFDMDGSQMSRRFIDRFDRSKYFSLRLMAKDYRQIEASIDRGECLMGLVIPRDFSTRLQSGRPVSVQAFVDGSNSNTASIALGYASTIAAIYSQEHLAEVLGKTLKPVDPQIRVWFNTELKSRNYIIPGIMVVIMMVIASLLTSLTIAREWENGTMQQLISTPLQPGELILGKMTPYFFIGFLDMLLSVVMGTQLFRVPLKGNPLVLFALSSLFLVGGLSLGLLYSILVKNQLFAYQLAMLTSFLPSFILSDFTFPITGMPPAVRLLTYLVPARYFVTIVKGIFLKGVGVEILWMETVLLGVFGGTVFLIANMSLKKRLQ